MTPNKAKIKMSMIQHLQAKGYPNLTSKQILAELKPMWEKLRSEGLLPQRWQYADFAKVAHDEEYSSTLHEAMRDELFSHLRGGRR